MLFIELLLIGISLSMDAFSLALSIGIYYNQLNVFKYALTTGVYHFVMTLLGFLIKSSTISIININEKAAFIFIIVLIICGILLDNNKDSNKIINPLVFGLSVSLDSFMIGITLKNNYLLFACIIFSITSFIFTLLGFKLSSYLNKKYDQYSKYISITILLIILIFHLIS